MLREKVEEIINKVRPMLQADGGDIELVDVSEDSVYVRLKGACGGCPMAQLTLRNAIEARLREEIPELKKVEAVP